MASHTTAVVLWMAAILVFSSGPGSAQGQEATNPHGPIPAGMDCSGCHSAAGWTPVLARPGFDHDRATPFPLAGAHATVDCAGCHLDLRFSALQMEDAGCATCHFDVHQGKLGTDCVRCHTAQSFTDVQAVDIHAGTFFPLTGSHLQLSCDACHANERRGAFSGQDTDCVFCHAGDYDRAQPDHEARGFSTSCESCHGTLTWVGASASAGRVALEWGDCLACHVERIPPLTRVSRAAGQGAAAP